ncbi:TPA: YhbY family RNA-binding protein [Candidatus Woesearchaeota archaeon]|nr:YhbY family RNA-binding protein [Candidatus Woesearchaeota archaeon]HII69256.1 YhbY family RNA-binding protein [Candidatus Woesearchaeota archaeon]
MPAKTRKELKSESKILEPKVRIGKSGMSDAVVAEIKKVLKTNPLFKVKLLKGALAGKDKKDVAREVAEKTGTVLIDQIGFTIVIARRSVVREEDKK